MNEILDELLSRVSSSSLPEDDKRLWGEILPLINPHSYADILSYIKDVPTALHSATEDLKTKIQAMKSGDISKVEQAFAADKELLQSIL